MPAGVHVVYVCLLSIAFCRAVSPFLLPPKPIILGTEAEQGEDSGNHRFRTRPDLRPPHITVQGSGSPGYIFFTPYSIKNIYGPGKVEIYLSLVIADSRSGDIIWAEPTQTVATNLKLQKHHGEDALVYWTGLIDDGSVLTGVNYILNSSYSVVDQVMAEPLPVLDSGIGRQKWEPSIDPHDILLQDETNMITIVVDVVPRNLSSYGGPEMGFVFNSQIRKIDLQSRIVIFNWNSADHISMSESLWPILPEYRVGTAEMPWDYVHINSLDVHPTDGSILISTRHASTVYKINATTGEIIWRLGGKKSDFTMEEGSVFHAQHHAQWLSSNEISLFDNHERLSPDGSLCHSPEASFIGPYRQLCSTYHGYGKKSYDRPPSRGIILSLDFETMKCRLKTEFKHPNNPAVVATGSMQMLPNGNAFLGYGHFPYGAEFSSNGSLISTIRFGIDGAADGSYRMLKFNWTSNPTTVPDVVIFNGALYMSWNGATEVKSWNIYAGPSSDHLTFVQRATKDGFETAVLVPPSGGGFYRVEAIDEGNRSLAVSRVIRSDGHLLSDDLIQGQGYMICNDASALLALAAALGLLFVLAMRLPKRIL